MNKKIIRSAAFVLLMALLAVAAAAPIRSSKVSATDWMAGLDDERSISTLSIPGTHDSGALYSFADVFGKCQSLPVSEQLDMGVRFLDLRLRLVDEDLKVYHNFVEQKMDLEVLIEQIVSFLRENPSEFLLVSVKEEAQPIRSQTAFSEKLESMLSGYPDVVSTDSELPENVGDARGKIYILARYEDNTMGIPCARGWQDSTSFAMGDIYVQDRYKVRNAEEKKQDILGAIDTAASGEYGLVLNYASCYFAGGFPPSYAGIPARKLNPWLVTQLPETEGALGVLACDFITSELAGIIIGRNFA